MDKKDKINSKNKKKKDLIENEEYSYSFVPELDMWLNIDLQKENANKFSELTNDDNRNNNINKRK